MYSLLDMSTPREIRVVLFTDNGPMHEELAAGKNVELLTVLDAALQQQSLTHQDIDGIAVVVGVGTFTSTRLAVTVANTFAYANQISLTTVSDPNVIDYATLAVHLSSAVPGQFISATYSGVPRIGTKS